MLPAGGFQEALGQIGAGPERSRPDEPFDFPKRLESSGSVLELAARDPGVDEQLEHGSAVELALVGQPAQKLLAKLDSAKRLALIQRQPGAAKLGSR
ncbi:MAG: hypothetical protein ABR529_15220 [Actinomycetota bacterium]